MNTFRIHGDNIVECERIANLILNTLRVKTKTSYLISPSTVAIEIHTTFLSSSLHWKLILLPGFNKNTKRRWQKNIFDSLKQAGSFFDETPDAIITKVDENCNEKIILGIEFCSALQAGNQAWQRSGRAFSTGRTGCPYLYIVDFVKYELDYKANRKRKALRFPNPAVPYSYINYSKTTGNFIAQLYTKSEEFDKAQDSNIKNFNEADFGSDILGTYIVKLMLGISTSAEEKIILEKNMNVVKFLANHFNSKKNYTSKEWQDISLLKNRDIIDYAIENKRFKFHKKTAKKSQHGFLSDVIELVDEFAVGLASKDLPLGIIPAKDRISFAQQLFSLYPDTDRNTINSIANNSNHLLIAIIKGFKPRGDDNRPDRGLHSLIAMLSSIDTEVLTLIYGPIIEKNFNLMASDNDRIKLAKKNGLWLSILSLSDYVILESPILSNRNSYSISHIYNTKRIKQYYTGTNSVKSLSNEPLFSNIPVTFGEDDVDTGIHYLFTHVLGKYCFEGLCNPPGGDWSGFSVIDGNWENRWLSLPRESKVINGKRPDHVLEIFGVFSRPLLLSIESKERSADLEADVGTQLITYIRSLMDFIPSAKRKISPNIGDWEWGVQNVDFSDFTAISVAAYLKEFAESNDIVFQKNCEMLFIMDPLMNDKEIGWDIEIIPSTERSTTVKNFIINKYRLSGDNQFTIH